MTDKLGGVWAANEHISSSFFLFYQVNNVEFVENGDNLVTSTKDLLLF